MKTHDYIRSIFVLVSLFGFAVLGTTAATIKVGVQSTATSVVENSGNYASFTVTRYDNYASPLEVSFKTGGFSGRNDYVLSHPDGKVSIPAGNAPKSASVVLFHRDDEVKETDETVKLVLMDDSLGIYYVDGNQIHSTITIIDDDAGTGWPSAFNPMELKTFRITMNPTDWNQLVADESFTQEFLATVTVDGDPEFPSGNIRIRRKSDAPITAGAPTKVSLKFDINSVTPAYSYRGLQKMSFENGNKYSTANSGAGVVLEGLTWHLHRLAASYGAYDYEASLYSWVKIYVNGVYQGVYLNTEQRDDEALKNRGVYRPNSTWLYKFGDDISFPPPPPHSPTWNQICFSPFGTGCPKPSLPEVLLRHSTHVDMDSFSTLGAVNGYVYDVDSFFPEAHNTFRADFYSPKSRKSIFFSWDHDFVSFADNEISKVIVHPGYYYYGFTDPYYLQKFYEILDLLTRGPFDPDTLIPFIDDVETLLTSDLNQDVNRNFFNPTTSAAESTSVHFNRIRSWITQRTINVKGQIPAMLTPPTLNESGGSIHIANPNGTGSIWFTTDGTDPWNYDDTMTPSAQLYTTPIPLSGTRHVFARVKDSSNWSPATTQTFNVIGHAEGLMISELMYNPLDPTVEELGAGFDDKDDFEFIELINTDSSEIDVSGCYLDGISYTFPPGTRLQPDQLFVLVRNPAAFEMRYPCATYDDVYWDGGLSNSGETISLYDDSGNLIFSICYNDDDAHLDDCTPNVNWPSLADGGGRSLVRINFSGDPNDPENWDNGLIDNGSPGQSEESASGRATFVRIDVLTQGEWINEYGAEGYNVIGDTSLFAPNVNAGIVGGTLSYWAPYPYVGEMQRASNPSQYVQAAIKTADYVVNDFFEVNLSFDDLCEHQLALYLVDYEAATSFTAKRIQRIDVFNALTGMLLDSQSVTDFNRGKHLVWTVSGHLRVRITYLGGYKNAVLNGIFVDSVRQPEIWFDDYDDRPSNAVYNGFPVGWQWTSSPTPVSGDQIHFSPFATSLNMHSFYDTSDTFHPRADDVLFTYLFIDPSYASPSTVLLQWKADDGSGWNHRANWGLISYPTLTPQEQMGSIPPAGQWVKLEIPAWQVNASGRALNGMMYLMKSGQAGWDLAGKEKASLSSDTDKDGLPDGWEIRHFGHLGFGPYDDNDSEGLLNFLEWKWNSSPNNYDTDGDGIWDVDEVFFDFVDPSLADTDGDTYSDPVEINAGTDPLDKNDHP